MIKTLIIQPEAAAVLAFSLSPSGIIGDLNAPVTVLAQGQDMAAWDGNAQNGTPVSNGQYYIQITSVDPYGTATTVTQPVAVNRSYVQVAVRVYNEAGEVVRTLLTQTLPTLEGVVHSLTLSTPVIRPNSKDGGAPAWVTIQVDSGMVIPAWDGDNDAGMPVQSGQYYISVHTVDGNGGDSTLTQGIVVMNEISGSQLVLATPNLITGTDPRFTFTVQAGLTNVVMDGRIYDLAGELLGHFSAKPQGGKVVWQAGWIASGIYLAVVTLSNSDGDMIGRQILRIAVVH